MTDRDTFAAAALTGLLATGQGPYHCEDYFAKAAYKAADAMLRERGDTEPMPKQKRAEVSYTTSQGSVPGEGSVLDSRTENEPVAWAVCLTPVDTEIVDLCRTLEDCRYKWSNRTSDSWRYVPLYRHPQPTLTDEEREAVKLATDFLEDEFYGCSDKCAAEHNAVVTLRKLLERVGGKR